MDPDNIFMDENEQLNRIPIVHEVHWDGLGKATFQRCPPPRTSWESKVVFLEEWALLTQIFIDTLINSMTARYEACIPVNGGNSSN
ncbi:hypothetical protein TNCV_951031 [Trichonephila clavipes]|nr:hypothetical protein TNCV_951031 [Trichonephila clavipes]